jgi:hypothetical protein
MALSSLPRSGGCTTAHPVTIDNRWASDVVVLTKATPAAVVRLTFTYSGRLYYDSWPSAVVSAPEHGNPGATGGTPDPAYAMAEPAVRMEFVDEAVTDGPCAAPCERRLPLPDCSGICTASIDVRLTLMDAAGWDSVSVTLRAGLSARDGSPLPGGFHVEMRPLASPSATVGGSG